MEKESETQVTNTTGVRIIPSNLGLVHRPFDASAKRKCYIVFDKGPPRVLQEVNCGDIVIVDHDVLP